MAAAWEIASTHEGTRAPHGAVLRPVSATLCHGAAIGWPFLAVIRPGYMGWSGSQRKLGRIKVVTPPLGHLFAIDLQSVQGAVAALGAWPGEVTALRTAPPDGCGEVGWREQGQGTEANLMKILKRNR